MNNKKKADSGFNEHERKALIRRNWCKPQLSQLHQSLNNKLEYLGLPDIKALDVLEWIDHIDRVIAFQCSNYNGERINVKELDDLLAALERQQKIKSGFVYQGFMEDIIMGAASERGDLYRQNDYLRIYNLDFCNNLTTPRRVYDLKGRPIDYYKTDIIRKLLQYQKGVNHSGISANFIMYLTVNSDTFNEQELGKIVDSHVKTYLKKITKINKPEVKASRNLKAYCYNMLQTIFKAEGFHAEFLPTVYYLGSAYPNKEKGGKLDNHRMMTFTILGSKQAKDEPLFSQDTTAFLDQKFIFATDTVISPYNDTYIQEATCEHDAEKLLKGSGIYNKFWAPKSAIKPK